MGVIECPQCQTALPLSEDGHWITCESCHHRLNVRAQQAYGRARAAFQSVQDLIVAMPPAPIPGAVYRTKTRLNLSPLSPEIVRAYQQTYSGLNIAFQYDLLDVQKLSGIEMMAEIARVFAPRAMMSPLEAEYWTKLLIEVTVLRELTALDDRLTRPSYSVSPGFVNRWRWRLRRHQLKRAVNKLRVKITEIERALGFLNPPRVH